MTHPKQDIQIIKQQPNDAAKRLDEQLEQAKIAFSAAKAQLVPRNNRFLAKSTAKCMGMLRPRERTYYENMQSKIIKGMFPARVF